MPDRYRFTGWMTATVGPTAWPGNLLVDGDDGTLRFADRWHLTHNPVAYRVCVVRLGSSTGPCRERHAPTSTVPSVIPVFVHCCGDFVARWYVAGRLVATWPFRYIPETYNG